KPLISENWLGRQNTSLQPVDVDFIKAFDSVKGRSVNRHNGRPGDPDRKNTPTTEVSRETGRG
ncbi:MAG: hypothetical protein MK133_09815, partial [Planctomycetes bacterium]|nr:hypothetical protein [Planctomycetota bacterium]